tara:strand:+ start:1510 stop:3762 length:2253 start_codon:yes stop_codon:yes gene_type:complete
MYINSMMYKFLIFFIIFVFKTNLLFSEIVNDIKVSGNDRVSSETIVNFSKIVKGNDYSQNDLNEALKNLYDSNFFENVKLNLENQILLIKVAEYPIIQQITINGIKASKTVKLIKEELTLKDKNPFIKSLVQNDVNRLINSFKQSGFYFAVVDVKIKDNTNNTVDIIFDIDRGDKATIKEIKFIGDKKYKDRKLNSIITSEEDKLWKFISNKKYINIERINLDKRLLKNFYLNKGFYQVEVTDAYSQVTDQKNFILTFNINAGKKFYFGKFNLDIPEDFDRKKFISLEETFKDISTKKYEYKSIEKILDQIEKIALNENYEFINANVIETVENNKVNFNFEITESEKLYVNKINIFGNNITNEEFIRNNLLVDEGDPFNKILHSKSINKLRSKGLFKSVKSNLQNTEDERKTDVNITIEEKPTGEIMAGAGYGTDGSTFSVGIKENNFNGKGISLETNLSLTEESVKGFFRYTHPNFAYSDRALSTSLESTVTDKLTNFGYKSSLNKISLGTRYEQFENTFFSPSISISSESLTTTSSASKAYKKQEGSYFDTTFGYGLTLDRTNSAYQPTSGFYSSWYQQLPVISENQTIVNGYIFSVYKELADDMILSSGLYSRAVNSLTNDDVRVSKRLFVPSRRLRGFESGKVGPKDGDDYIGGNYVVTFNTSSTLPYLLQTQENMDLKLFFDAGNIWGVDYSSLIDDSNKIRSSAGVSLEITTLIGPLSFSWAEAITKASTDRTESFKFQLGTTF